MTESTNVSLNLQSPNISTVVYAVQNDRLSRRIVAQLLDGSAAWTPPAGWSAAIRYLKPDGTGGFYDRDEANNAAITISGSVATLTIAEQALTVAGDVYMQLNFYTSGGDKLTTFAWILRVQKSVLTDATIVSSDYYNTLTATIAAGIPVAQALTFPVPISNGGTGAATLAAAQENLNINSPYNATPLFGSTPATQIAANVSIALSQSATNFKFLILTLYSSSATAAAGNRGYLLIPAGAYTSAYWRYQAGTEDGYVRLAVTDENLKITFYATDSAALYVGAVVGVK